MMKRRVEKLLAAAFCICAVTPVPAHHSHPYFYDQCKNITIEGRVESVQWIDPHILIVLRLDDGTAHTVDWTALRAMTNARTIDSAKAALVPQARIVVTGNPIRTLAQIRERFPDYPRAVNPNTVDPMRIRRLDDTWIWARTSADRMPDFVPASCAEPAAK